MSAKKVSRKTSVPAVWLGRAFLRSKPPTIPPRREKNDYLGIRGELKDGEIGRAISLRGAYSFEGPNNAIFATAALRSKSIDFLEECLWGGINNFHGWRRI